jgi:hypothetical protein
MNRLRVTLALVMIITSSVTQVMAAAQSNATNDARTGQLLNVPALLQNRKRL